MNCLHVNVLLSSRSDEILSRQLNRVEHGQRNIQRNNFDATC